MEIPRTPPPIIPPKDIKKPDETTPPEPPKTPKPPTPPPEPPKGPKLLNGVNVLDYLLDEPTTPPPPLEPPAPPLPPVVAPGVDGVSETDGLGLPKDVDELTEEEAIEQGYTIIKTAEDLAAMANNPSGKYILINDIDLSGIEWTPIGSNEDPFTGILNGNGKK